MTEIRKKLMLKCTLTIADYGNLQQLFANIFRYQSFAYATIMVHVELCSIHDCE